MGFNPKIHHKNHAVDCIKPKGHLNGQNFVPFQGFQLLFRAVQSRLNLAGSFFFLELRA